MTTIWTFDVTFEDQPVRNAESSEYRVLASVKLAGVTVWSTDGTSACVDAELRDQDAETAIMESFAEVLRGSLAVETRRQEMLRDHPVVDVDRLGQGTQYH